MPSIVVFFALLVATFITNGCCDDGTAEATLLALETSGQLLAPISLVGKFRTDLKTIRTAYPEVSSVFHSPRWFVGVLLVKFNYQKLEQIRIQYGEVTSRPLTTEYNELKFAKPYNPEALAKELMSKNLVELAKPNLIVGGGDTISFNARIQYYTFTKGWGDCLSGCIYKHSWVFYLVNDKVFLRREYGTPLNVASSV